MTHPHTRRGFTLIELIIVIAIIAIIAAGAFVALDPARRLHAGRNGTRWTDATAILQAIKTYQVNEYDNAMPPNLDSTVATVQVLGTAALGCDDPACAAVTAVAACLDVATALSGSLTAIPKDPSTGADAETRYYVNKDANGVITVGACDAEGEGAGGGTPTPTIKVTN